MSIYKGYRTQDCGPLLVTKDREVLSPKPSQKLCNHSPDGFQWGYGGSGPAQLALALLLDASGDSDRALAGHQAFKRAFVAGWGEKWEITTEEILAWLKKH